jgi:hypothetical protein
MANEFQKDQKETVKMKNDPLFVQKHGRSGRAEDCSGNSVSCSSSAACRGMASLRLMGGSFKIKQRKLRIRGNAFSTELWLSAIFLSIAVQGCTVDFQLASALDTDTFTETQVDAETNAASDSDTEDVMDSHTGTVEASDTDADTDTTDTSPTCSDGLQNGKETGVDCGGPCPACGDPVFSSPTPDISIPARCFAPNEIIVITKHKPSNNPSMDWIWVPDDNDWWTYMPDSKYSYQAPDKVRTYDLKFYWNDAEDKDCRSSLVFEVSHYCP